MSEFIIQVIIIIDMKVSVGHRIIPTKSTQWLWYVNPLKVKIQKEKVKKKWKGDLQYKWRRMQKINCDYSKRKRLKW